MQDCYFCILNECTPRAIQNPRLNLGRHVLSTHVKSEIIMFFPRDPPPVAKVYAENYQGYLKNHHKLKRNQEETQKRTKFGDVVGGRKKNNVEHVVDFCTAL